MNSPAHKLVLATALMMTATVSAADEADITYVDSVKKWGAWGLDIEPAAGGLSQASTQALNARGTKVALRTNSFSALAPPASFKSPATPVVPGPPVSPPVIPIAPPPPPPVVPTMPAAPTNFAPPGTSTTTPVILP